MVDPIADGWYEEIGVVFMGDWPYGTDEESLREVNDTLPENLAWVPYYDDDSRMKLMEYKTN